MAVATGNFVPTECSDSRSESIRGIANWIAFILFFQLVVDVEPVVSLTVTFLVPIMAFLWGAVFLNEQITLITIVGGGVVLAGTALTIGVEKLRPQPRLT